jgi:hypothetical protein
MLRSGYRSANKTEAETALYRSSLALMWRVIGRFSGTLGSKIFDASVNMTTGVSARTLLFFSHHRWSRMAQIQESR